MSETKLEQISRELNGIDIVDMTVAEFNIWNILNNQSLVRSDRDNADGTDAYYE